MKRDPEALENGHFDLVVVGGGVTGGAIAWDAALRGLKTALVEKGDFGHGTSSATTKLIHGGLRYLAKYQFKIVRESLCERRRLLRNMPHIAFPLPFLLPVYRNSFTSRWLLKIGMLIYDLFSYDKNELPDPDKFLSNHKWLTREEALQREPHLNSNGLIGAFAYYDVLNRYPERANLEYILSADSRGAVCANYMEAMELVVDDTKKVNGVRVRDLQHPDKREFVIHGDMVINAGGPWGEKVTKQFKASSPYKIVLSKGIHFLTPRINNNHAIVFETREGRHFFIVPWLDYSLIGTTDHEFTGSLDDVHADKKEIQELMKLLSSYYPVKITGEKILHSYAGVRPLVSFKKNNSTYELSRKHEIVNHRKTDGYQGCISVYGGKWTTSRALAQDAVDLVVKENKLNALPCRTRNTPVIGAEFGESFSHFLEDAIKTHAGQMDEKTISHLASYYGAEYRYILQMIQSNPKLAERIDPAKPHLLAEIHWAVQSEQCMTLSDFMLRRSSLGNEGGKSNPVVSLVAKTLASLLDWDGKRTEAEIADYMQKVRIHIK